MTEPTATTRTDLETRLRDVPAAGGPPRLPDPDVAYVVDDTVVGRVLLARRATGELVASRYVADDGAEDALLDRLAHVLSPRVLRRPGALDVERRELDDFLAGRRHAFTTPTDLVLATPFQRAVLETLTATVGYGRRETYGGLARALRRPSASRAVGAALGANPLCIVVPCHRVVGASGALTGYAGGTAAKEYLLTLEAQGAPA